MTTSLQATGGDLYGAGSQREPANLGDILERVLDKGLVIAGDIRVNLLDIELLTIKLRLVVASLETAREVGIDWWVRDPWLRGTEDTERLEASDHKQLAAENERLRRRIGELTARQPDDAHAGDDGSDDR
ncbi:gas vesicle protein [Actinocatenispora rupis]|uniref:Putative gas vesicle protein GvpJ 1 n=1 Tax=Actinocatenispora rupis TaxID=519421 RepID=A0A8J3J4L1_9ACTN|nr:gas vesicle protein [Actinocatenispora rupis]GID14595.1 putative gas vesicle protein GvpJ 1 [Actinocatenispora rupis]